MTSHSQRTLKFLKFNIFGITQLKCTGFNDLFHEIDNDSDFIAPLTKLCPPLLYATRPSELLVVVVIAHFYTTLCS